MFRCKKKSPKNFDSEFSISSFQLRFLDIEFSISWKKVLEILALMLFYQHVLSLKNFKVKNCKKMVIKINKIKKSIK